MIILGRRAFFVLAGLLSPFGILRGVAQGAGAATAPVRPVSLNDFLALSSRLTARTNLDPEVGQEYLTAFAAVPKNVPLLAALARSDRERADRTPAHRELEREIITSWYSGIYYVDGQRKVATHSGALVWRVLGRPAPGTCVPPAGSWSSPPRVTGV